MLKDALTKSSLYKQGSNGLSTSEDILCMFVSELEGPAAGALGPQDDVTLLVRTGPGVGELAPQPVFEH